MSDLATRLSDVDSRIADAVRDAGRAPTDVTRIVITKFHPARLVQELAELAVKDFGENRHQEARVKHETLSGLDVRWHFVGQLQSNKARAVAAYADAIHSVDRASLVDALAKAERRVPCFVELNLTDDPGRGGVDDAGLEPLVEHVAASGIELLGVMAVATQGAEPRAEFARVRALSERVRSIVPTATSISAGMSGDFRAAVLEGATHVRIGTAITGPRPRA